ncbi:hypothetical protein GCM10028786_16600 [Flaviaesturariibacter terrae]
MAATYSWSVTYQATNCGASSSWSFAGGSTASSLNPSFTFANPGTYTIKLSVTNACTTSTYTKDVIVKGPPTVSINAISDRCVPATITPRATVTNCGTGALTYSWSFPSGSPATGTGANPGTVSYGAAGTYSVNLDVSNECGLTNATKSFAVNQTPDLTVPASLSLCPGAATGPLTFSSTLAGTTFSWTNDNTTIGLSSSSGNTNIASFNAVNNTAVNQVANITVTATKGTCTKQDVFTITVKPKPAITDTTVSICSEGSFAFTPSAGRPLGSIVPSNTTYTWPAPTTPTQLSVFQSGTDQTSLTGTLTNSIASAVTATYSVTPKADGCAGSAFNFKVTVKPKPSIANASVSTCSGTAFTFSPSGTAPNIVPSSGLTYSWTVSAPASVSGASDKNNQSSISQTLINSGSTAVNVVYTVTPTADGCSGAAFTLTVTVKPKPNVQNASASICSGATFTVTPLDGATIVPANSTYTWSTPSMPAGVTGAGSGTAASSISGTLNNSGSSVQQVAYSVTPTADGCPGTAFTVTVSVVPGATLSSVSDRTYCNGSSSGAISLSATPAGTDVSWTNSNTAIGLAASGNGSIAAFTATNTGNAPATATITVTATYNNGGLGCNGSTRTFTITVNPTPSADAISSQTLCNGSATAAISFSGSVSGSTYNWTNSNGTIGLGSSGSGTSIASFTATNTGSSAATGNFVVTPSYSNAGQTCTGGTKAFSITVNPTPTVTAISNQELCNGAASTAVSFSGAVNGADYEWTNDLPSIGLAASGSGSIASFNAINNGSSDVTATITVTPKKTNGTDPTCTGTARSFTIKVHPTPTVNPVTSQTRCVGTSTTAISFGGSSAGTSYAWTNSDNSIGIAASGAGDISSFTTLNSTNTPLVASLSVTPKIGACSGTAAAFTITVNPKPKIGPLTASICSNDSFHVNPLNNAPTTIVPAGTTYIWGAPQIDPVNAISNGGAQNTPSNSIGQFLTNGTSSNATATYSVTPQAPVALGGCSGDPFTVTVSVNPQPGISSFTRSTCSGDPINVTPSGVPSGTNYSWTTPPAVTPSGAVTGVTTSANGISAINETLTNTTNAAASVQYTVAPTAGTCGNGSFTITINVDPKPAINNYTLADICSGDVISVQPANGVAPAVIVPANSTYTWTVSSTSPVGGAVDGSSTNGIISQQLTNNGTSNATVTYTVTPKSGSCTGADFTIKVVVKPKPVLAPVQQAICSGNAFSVTPGNVPSGTTYTWPAPQSNPAGVLTGNAQSSGVTSIGESLVNATNAAANLVYTVTPVSNGCTGNDFTITVTVNPKASVTNYFDTLCSGGSFLVTPQHGIPATNSIPAGTLYTWGTPSDPSNAISGDALQALPGATSIGHTLANSSNAPATLTYTVTPHSGDCVGPDFTVSFTVNPRPKLRDTALTTCSGAAFNLAPPNTAPAQIVPAPTSYSWNAPVVTGGLTSGQAGSNAASIGGSLGNPTTDVQTATYTIAPVSGAAGHCVGDSFRLVVTVNPQPGIGPQDTAICSGTAFDIRPPGVPSNTNYSWTLPQSSPANAITGGSLQSNQGSIGQTLTNNTNVPATLLYSVTPTAGSCGNSAFTVTVTVNPKPVIGSLSADICSGESFLLDPQNGTAAGTIVPVTTTYSWGQPSVSPTGAVTGTAQSGRPNIGELLNNGTNALATVTYQVTPTSTAPGACAGDAFPVTVQVRPRPLLADKTLSVCSGTAFTLRPDNTLPDIVPGNSTYSWAAPTVTGGLLGGTDGTDLAQLTATLINPTNVAQSADYLLTPKSGSCTGTPFHFRVTVLPTPKVPALTDAICSGQTFNFQPANAAPATIIPAGTLYSWNAPTSSPLNAVTNGSAQSGQDHIGQLLTNATNQQATVTYSVTPATAGCTGDAFAVTITVHPKPVIGDLNTTICSGSSFNLSPQNAAPGTIVPQGSTYAWASPSSNPPGAITGGSSQTAASSITDVLFNNTIQNATAQYLVTPTSGNADHCAGAPFTVTVLVKPQPTLSDQAATICSGDAFLVNPPNAPAGTTYSWVLPQPTPAGVISGGVALNNQPDISGTLVNNSNATASMVYVVRPSASNCSNSTFNVTVTVQAKPVIPTQTATICTGGTFLIDPVNNAPSVIVPAGSTYTWTTPSSAPINAVTGGAAQPSAAPNISQQLANAGVAPATLTYSVTPKSGTAGGCVGAPFDAVVTVNPDARARLAPTDTTACPPFLISPQVLGLVPYPNANGVYNWFANGAPIGTGLPFPGYTIANEYDSIDIKLMVTSAFGCKPDSTAFRFYTYKLPHPEFSLTPSGGCGPLSVQVVNNTPYAADFQYQWNFGQGQSSGNMQPGAIVFPPNPTFGDTVYQVKLMAYNECDTVIVTKPVAVSSKPKALFTPDHTTGCSPMRVVLTNTSLGIGATYTWIWDDGTPNTSSPDRSPVTHVFNTGVQDTFYVKLAAVNNCGSDTATYAIVVSPNPIRLLMAVNGTQQNGCAPHSVQFINNTLGATGFHWDFADGNTLNTTRGVDTVTHTFLAAGIYNVRLTAFNGCTDTTMTLAIEVFPKPVAAFSADRLTVCLGDSIHFTNNSSNGASSYLWQFGDGAQSTLTSPAHAYSVASTYDVKLIAYRFNAPGNVCSDSLTVPVLVVAGLPGGISLSDSISRCVPFTVTFSNPNQPSSASTWDFGDGSSATGNVVTHTYQQAGIYIATLTSVSPGGCTYSALRRVRIDAPAGSFTYNSGYICGGRSVRFDATVSGTDTLIWNFGDGSTQATLQHVAFHTYPNPGLYVPSVTLASTAGCHLLLPGVDTIRVDRIVAGYTATQNRSCGSTDVTFRDTSNVFFGISRIEWDFGDGTTGSGPLVRHGYSSSGAYNIREIVFSGSGCSDTVLRVLNVTVSGIPTAAISAPPQACSGIPATLLANVQSVDPITLYEWSVNGTVQSSANLFTPTFTAPGTYAIRLVAGTANGCFDTARLDLTVRPTPVVTASPSQDLCLGRSTQLNATGNGVVQWGWSPIQGLSCSSCPNPVATPNGTTPYLVTGTNSFGCPGYDTVVITVHGPIHMSVSPDDSICVGDAVQLLATGAASYVWRPDQYLDNDSIPNPMATPPVTTRYQVVGYDGWNCYNDTAYVLVAVGNYPTVNLGPDLQLATGTLRPLVTTITNGPIRDWTWSPTADLSCGNCPLPTATIRNNVVYTVRVTTFYGCSATDSLVIRAFCKDAQVFLPNAFSPDGDGVNDVFMVQGSGILRVKTFRVFNRWGELVFEKNEVPPNDPRFGWDGRVIGHPAAPDVYVYTVEVLCENGTPYTYKGNVTILK